LPVVPCQSRAQDSTPTNAPAATAPTASHAEAAATPEPRRAFPPAEAGPIAEDTSMAGKPAVDLKGVWLLVANAELVPGTGKFKTFTQMFAISQGKSGPTFHLLDVRLPGAIAEAIATANADTSAWQPDAAALKTLRQSWRTLPPAKQKALDEFLYLKIHYTVAAPDNYGAAFPRRDEAADKVLKDSKVALLIREEYKSRDLGRDSRIAQMIARDSLYGVKGVEKDRLKGNATISLVAAGAGAPIPFSFRGPFVMYRLGAP
jgi:hypothetical protein